MFWEWVFLLSSLAECPGWTGEQLWYIFANQRLANIRGGTPGASLSPKRNPRRLIANGTGVTTSFLGYLSAWEEARGALNARVLACERVLRTGQKKLGKHPKGKSFAAPSYGNQPRWIPKGETLRDARTDLAKGKPRRSLLPTWPVGNTVGSCTPVVACSVPPTPCSPGSLRPVGFPRPTGVQPTHGWPHCDRCFPSPDAHGGSQGSP